MRIYISMLLLMLTSWVYTQDYQEGYDYLEQGNFSKATSFFEKAIEASPENITANICYGRAIGLNGQTIEAVNHFEALKAKNKGHYELKLNLAESYMWNDEPAKATELYNALIEERSDNFVAHYGGANAYAARFQYDQAYELINRSLELEPTNGSALNSRKYILLGFANGKKDNNEIEEAIRLVELADSEYPNDIDVMFLKANIALADDRPHDAKKAFNGILDREKDNFEGLMGLAYAQLLLNNLNQAFFLSDKALNIANPEQALKARLFKVTALGAQKKFKQAREYLVWIESSFGESRKTALLHTQLDIWDQKLHKGYNQLESFDLSAPNWYENKMAMVETLMALKCYKKANELVDEILIAKPTADAIRLGEQCRIMRLFKVDFLLRRDKDNGGNISNLKGLEIRKNIACNMQAFLQLERRDAENELINNNAQQSLIRFGSYHQILKNTNLMWSVGLLNATNMQGQSSNSLIGELLLSQKIFRYHIVGLGVAREAHNYTVDLITNMIHNTHYKLEYSYNEPRRPGIYAQYIHTDQSDGNQRKLFYGSAYYNLSTFPIVQLGVSYSQFMFRNEADKLYFSPSDFNAQELFVKYSNKSNLRNKITLDGMAAFGFQQIELEAVQNTKRVELQLGYRPNRKYHVELGYRYSDAVNIVRTGFVFNQFKLTASMRI